MADELQGKKIASLAADGVEEIDLERREVRFGEAEVRETFKVPKIGVIAGCFVRNGVIIVGRTVSGLLDHAVSADERTKIETVLTANASTLTGGSGQSGSNTPRGVQVIAAQPAKSSSAAGSRKRLTRTRPRARAPHCRQPAACRAHDQAPLVGRPAQRPRQPARDGFSHASRGTYDRRPCGSGRCVPRKTEAGLQGRLTLPMWRRRPMLTLQCD